MKCLKTLADCRRCINYETCPGTCPAVEALLLAEGKTSWGMSRDKIITESEWRVSNDNADEHREVNQDDDNCEDGNLYENYITTRPALHEVMSEPGENIEGEIITGLWAPLTIDQIASECNVDNQYVEYIRDVVLEQLGCNSEFPTLDQKIWKAVIADGLTTSAVAEIFSKKVSYISARKKKGKAKLKGLFDNNS